MTNVIDWLPFLFYDSVHGNQYVFLVIQHEDVFHSQIGIVAKWLVTRDMDGELTFKGINDEAFEIAFRHVKATADRKQKEFVDRYHLKG